jgi:hypothetical protein
MGRPAKIISPAQVAKLTALGATTKEMADFFEVSPDTLERRFAAEIAKGRANLKIRLRRLQLRAAEQGSVAMLIFLGKAMLNQQENGPDDIRDIRVVFEEKKD